MITNEVDIHSCSCMAIYRDQSIDPCRDMQIPSLTSPSYIIMTTHTLTQPGSSAIQLLVREVEVLKRVNHPNIIQLEEVFETAKVRIP